LDLGGKEGKLIYSLTDKSGKPVDDAKVKLVISRPVNDAKDIHLKPTISLKTFTFQKKADGI